MSTSKIQKFLSTAKKKKTNKQKKNKKIFLVQFGINKQS